jgi:GT2 family glycosyltransferase
MAVRKELFDRCGVFSTEIAITQDTELQLRFLLDGEQGRYAPQIKVFHKVSPGRLTPRYYYRWYYRRGRLLEVQDKYQRKFYHPFGIQFALIASTVKLLVSSLFVRQMSERIYRRSHGLFNLGQMVQIARNNII